MINENKINVKFKLIQNSIDKNKLENFYTKSLEQTKNTLKKI